MKLTVEEISKGCQAKVLLDGGRPVCGLSNDSRKTHVGELFVGLRTKTDDGARYIRNALENGAAGVLVEKTPSTAELNALKEEFRPFSVFEVDDTSLAIRRLGCFAVSKLRRENGCRVIAITGSSGKTTTKQMLVTALAPDFELSYTQGNLNNLIGVPMVICGAGERCNLLLLEFGISLPGEMDDLAEMVRPDIAVLTLVGEAHLEFLKDIQGVLREKMKIFSQLDEQKGVAVYNADDANIALAMASVTCGRKVGFGFGPASDVRGNYAGVDLSGTHFDVVIQGKRHSCQIPFYGRHMVKNALAAVAVGEVLGMTADSVCKRLAQGEAFQQRLERIVFPNGSVLFDDTYNANPQSMEEGLRLVKEIAERNKQLPVAIVGDMAELGEHAPQAHSKIGDLLCELGFHYVWFFGLAVRAAFEAVQGRIPCRYSEGTEANVATIAIEVREMMKQAPAVCLVKGSRMMKMERFVDMIKGV